jgi:hypothetical protein
LLTGKRFARSLCQHHRSMAAEKSTPTLPMKLRSKCVSRRSEWIRDYRVFRRSHTPACLRRQLHARVFHSRSSIRTSDVLRFHCPIPTLRMSSFACKVEQYRKQPTRDPESSGNSIRSCSPRLNSGMCPVTVLKPARSRSVLSISTTSSLEFRTATVLGINVLSRRTTKLSRQLART